MPRHVTPPRYTTEDNIPSNDAQRQRIDTLFAVVLCYLRACKDERSVAGHIMYNYEDELVELQEKHRKEEADSSNTVSNGAGSVRDVRGAKVRQMRRDIRMFECRTCLYHATEEFLDALVRVREAYEVCFKMDRARHDNLEIVKVMEDITREECDKEIRTVEHDIDAQYEALLKLSV